MSDNVPVKEPPLERIGYAMRELFEGSRDMALGSQDLREVMQDAGLILKFVQRDLEAAQAEAETAAEDEDEFYSADLPNPFEMGSWAAVGTYDTLAEAVAELRELGYHVDDEGRLALISHCEGRV